MPTVAEMKAEIAALNAAVEKKIVDEKSGAVASVRQYVADHGLTRADVFPSAAVAAKYNGPNGKTWSGRGLKPKWLADAIAGGAKLETFRAS